MYPTLKALVSAFTLPIARDSSFIGWLDTNYNFLVNTVFEFVKSQNSDKPNHVYSIFRSSFWTLIIMASVVSGGFFLHNNTSEFLHRLPSINGVTSFLQHSVPPMSILIKQIKNRSSIVKIDFFILFVKTDLLFNLFRNNVISSKGRWTSFMPVFLYSIFDPYPQNRHWKLGHRSAHLLELSWPI